MKKLLIAGLLGMPLALPAEDSLFKQLGDGFGEIGENVSEASKKGWDKTRDFAEESSEEVSEGSKKLWLKGKKAAQDLVD